MRADIQVPGAACRSTPGSSQGFQPSMLGIFGLSETVNCIAVFVISTYFYHSPCMFLWTQTGWKDAANPATWHRAVALSLKPPELGRCTIWSPASLRLSTRRRRHAQLLAPEGLVSGVSEETIQQAVLDSLLMIGDQQDDQFMI